MIVKFKNLILFSLNNLRNFLYQKIKYNKDYLFFSNLEDIEKHRKNFYQNKIRDRKTSIYNEKLRSQITLPREGVLDILEYTKKHNIKTL